MGNHRKDRESGINEKNEVHVHLIMAIPNIRELHPSDTAAIT